MRALKKRFTKGFMIYMALTLAWITKMGSADRERRGTSGRMNLRRRCYWSASFIYLSYFKSKEKRLSDGMCGGQVARD
jgi:hypothetical protein